MNDKEKRIKQERMTEATFHGLMGFSGKFGVIAKYLGTPIIEQKESMHSEHFTRSSVPFDFWESTYNDSTDDTLPTMDTYDTLDQLIGEPAGPEWTPRNNKRVSGNATQVGWHFDGMSRGIHLEIKYINDNSEIVVYYKGHVVYKEIAGDLFAYVPLDEWKEKVDSLHKTAKKLENESRKTESIERLEAGKKDKQSWIEQLRKTWGI